MTVSLTLGVGGRGVIERRDRNLLADRDKAVSKECPQCRNWRTCKVLAAAAPIIYIPVIIVELKAAQMPYGRTAVRLLPSMETISPHRATAQILIQKWRGQTLRSDPITQ